MLGNFLDESKIISVERIIDGDTIVVTNNTHVRLLGINTPEKGERYYKKAKDFLANMISNKTIKLEYGKDKTDLYGRTLAYIILDRKNINFESVKNGFANVYILDDKKYEKELRKAWEECIKENKNLCEKSEDKCADCIELKELNYKTQELIFYNKCDFDCNLDEWNIKDEGRKNFYFQNFILRKNNEVKIVIGNETNTNDILYWKKEKYVWTSTGDTLFLRDKEGRLVLWKNY